MQTVLIVIHLMIVLALVAVVLLQRSEGGGLGIGGGGGGNFTSRSSGNTLTRITGILAFAFFLTSLTLGILARYDQGPASILDRIESETRGTGQGILDQLGGPSPLESAPEPASPGGAGDIPSAAAPAAPAAPAEEAPASPDIPTGQ